MSAPETNMSVQQLRNAYWRKNLWIMSGLLVVWACVSLGCGVLLADSLNQYQLFGYPLGFWFAQQGSIITFVVLIFVYCLWMNHLDSRHHRQMEELNSKGGAA